MIHVNAKWLPVLYLVHNEKVVGFLGNVHSHLQKIWFTLILTFLLPICPHEVITSVRHPYYQKLVREIGVRDIWSKLLWNKTNPREMNFGSSYLNIPRISQPKCRHNWLQFLFCSQKSYWSSFSKLWVKLRNQGCEWSKKWLVKFTLIKRTEKYRHVQD